MLTEFGKVLRKLRINRQEILKDMADTLKVSSAYLSAVETGKRRIPTDWVSRISESYSLSQDEQSELQYAAEISTPDVTISLSGASPARRDAVLSFAKALDGMSDEELTKIMSAMKKTRKKRGDSKHA